MGQQMETRTTTTYREIGISDEVTTCEQCGRANLKRTVVLRVLVDGEGEGEVFVGSDCAAQMTGRTQKAVNRAAAAAQAEADRNRAFEEERARDILDIYVPVMDDRRELLGRFRRINSSLRAQARAAAAAGEPVSVTGLVAQAVERAREVLPAYTPTDKAHDVRVARQFDERGPRYRWHCTCGRSGYAQVSTFHQEDAEQDARRGHDDQAAAEASWRP